MLVVVTVVITTIQYDLEGVTSEDLSFPIHKMGVLRSCLPYSIAVRFKGNDVCEITSKIIKYEEIMTT